MMNWTEYQNRTYNNSVCPLLVDFVNNYKVSHAIDLGCGSGNESVYMIKNGIKVLSIDRQLNQNYILDRLNDEEKHNVSFLEKDFKSVELCEVDAVMAFFSIPFCKPDYFDELWDKIYNCLNDGGYFVGQLFGDRDAWKDCSYICTFSIDEVNKYLEKYEVLRFDEIEYVRESDNKKWHYYNIIARKTV